jgi:hypothetical protein
MKIEAILSREDPNIEEKESGSSFGDVKSRSLGFINGKGSDDMQKWL